MHCPRCCGPAWGSRPFDADTLVARRPPPDEALALVPSALAFEPGLRLPHRESAEGAAMARGWHNTA